MATNEAVAQRPVADWIADLRALIDNAHSSDNALASQGLRGKAIGEVEQALKDSEAWATLQEQEIDATLARHILFALALGIADGSSKKFTRAQARGLLTYVEHGDGACLGAMVLEALRLKHEAGCNTLRKLSQVVPKLAAAPVSNESQAKGQTAPVVYEHPREKEPETELASTVGTALAEGVITPEIEIMGERILRYLQMPREATPRDAYALATVALMHGLDPFAHELYWAPKLGVFFGIAGLRKLARTQSGYSLDFRQLTGEEHEQHGIQDTSIARICACWRFDYTREIVEINRMAEGEVVPLLPYEGIGIWARGERVPATKTPLWVAKKRAESEALRAAFGISFAYGEVPHETEDDGEVIDVEVVENAGRLLYGERDIDPDTEL